MRPYLVTAPVVVTSMRALPESTLVPAQTPSSGAGWSASEADPGRTAPATFATFTTGSDSPC